MRPLVLYHGPGCQDGFACKWIAAKRLPDAEFVPVNYGQPPPDVAGRTVFVLDFHYPRAVTAALTRAARKFVCLDHHVSAAADLQGLSAGSNEGLIRVAHGKSGGRMTWEYFHGDAPPPWLVDFTEDRDLWLWKLPRSRAVNAALASYPHDFAAWDLLALRTPDELADEGVAILRYQNQAVDRAVRNAVETDIGGHRVLATNATLLVSEIAGRLAEGRPFGATYFIRGDGRRVWSLRSRDGGVDVSEVARRFGGGGHAQAAGYEERVEGGAA